MADIGNILGAGGGLSGFWVPYTPVVTPGSGALTAVTPTGRMLRIGNTGMFAAKAVVTTNGTGASSLSFSLPSGWVAKNLSVFSAKETGVSFLPLYGYVDTGSSTVFVFTMANAYPAANGASIFVGGTLELA